MRVRAGPGLGAVVATLRGIEPYKAFLITKMPYMVLYLSRFRCRSPLWCVRGSTRRVESELRHKAGKFPARAAILPAVAPVRRCGRQRTFCYTRKPSISVKHTHVQRLYVYFRVGIGRASGQDCRPDLRCRA